MERERKERRVLILVLLVVLSVSMVFAGEHTLEVIFAEYDSKEFRNIQLEEGWNLISLGVIPDNKSVEFVFGDVMHEVVVINGFEGGAKTYDPEWPDFSDLKKLKPNYGYWVKMNKSEELNYNC